MAEPLPWPALDPIAPGWLGDTPPEAVARWRLRTPAERYAAFRRARATAWHFAVAGEHLRHPHLDAEALRARVRERMRRAVA